MATNVVVVVVVAVVVVVGVLVVIRFSVVCVKSFMTIG